MEKQRPRNRTSNRMQMEGQNVQATADKGHAVVHGSCMGKTITIDDEAYELLSSRKQGKRDSFSQVIHRSLPRKANTCGELEDIYDRLPPPDVDLKMLDRIEKERGRRSGGRK